MCTKFKILFVTIIIFIVSCQNEKVSQENYKVKIGKFAADTSYLFVKKQVAFGKRHMNTTEHENCKNWLVKKLKSYDFEVIEQPFDATSYEQEILKGTNIIGRHNPNVKERILLCAHYDTRHIAEKDTINPAQPIDGADDGASGVAVLLEIARQIKNNPIPMGVDIIFFDAEDYGSNQPGDDYSWGLGSQYWSKNVHEADYQPRYGILLDMVGSENATFPKEGYSMKTAARHVNKIWKFADQMGHGKYFVNRQVGYVTDDHRFVIENTSIPMIDIINIKSDGRFGHYHHTHSDNLEIISKETLGSVGQIILATVYKESNKDGF